jgi:hypothetical protein
MTSRTRPGPDAGLSRRGALGLGVGAATALVASGCALNNPLSSERTPAPEAVRDLAPDVAVAVEAATMVSAARAAVTATAERHVALAPKLAGLLAAHQAHLDAVVDAVPEGVDTSPDLSAPYVVPAGPAPALARVVATEHTLHDRLVGLALRAESGPFARLLGAMAAAVSQQLNGLAP